MPMMAILKSSPLVGEVGGGPAASVADKTPLVANQLAFANCSAPPPNPPHKGEGLKQLNLPAGATQRARRLRRDMTRAERHLWRALRIALPEQHWRKQVPFGPYIADFCSHGARLIIEVDGGQHVDAVEYDCTRTEFLKREGYRVLRFWNSDVLDNMEGVLRAVAEEVS